MSDELAAALALLPGAAARLLADHVDDGRGRRRRCTLGGQSGHHRWPCRLHDLARQGLALERQRGDRCRTVESGPEPGGR